MRVPDDQLPTPYPTRTADGWVRRPPTEDPRTSWLTQHVRVDLAEGPVDLVPSADGVTNPPPAELTILPSGADSPLPWRELDARRRTLAADLAPHAVRATLVAADSTWIEPAVAVTDLDEAAAVQLAVRHHLAAVLRWTATGLEVHPIESDVPDVVLPVTARRPAPDCPLRPTAGGLPCQDPGGPWTSASVHASAVHDAHRSLLAGELGCAPCAGRGPTRGRPVAIAGLLPPDRRGGWAWSER